MPHRSTRALPWNTTDFLHAMARSGFESLLCRLHGMAKYKPIPRLWEAKKWGQIHSAYKQYYEDQNAYLVDKEGGLKGSIPVKEIKVTPTTPNGVDNSQDVHHFTIENTSKGKIIEFSGEDAEGRDMWVQKIGESTPR